MLLLSYRMFTAPSVPWQGWQEEALRGNIQHICAFTRTWRKPVGPLCISQTKSLQLLGPKSQDTALVQNGPQRSSHTENSKKQEKIKTAEYVCTQWGSNLPLSFISCLTKTTPSCSSHGELKEFLNTLMLFMPLSFHALFFRPKLLFLLFSNE